MIQFKNKFSKKKFYNKYSYKITIELGMSAWVFRNDIGFIENFINKNGRNHSTSEENLNKVLAFLKESSNKNIFKRIEGKCIDFYTDDNLIFENLTDIFHSIIKQRCMPLPGINFSNDPSAITVRKLPYNKYQYKVYLKPHKLKNEKDDKIKYLEWLDSQKDKILISDAVKKWFLNTDWNWDRRYIYVEDEPTLLMLSMRNSLVLGRIHKHVINDKY